MNESNLLFSNMSSFYNLAFFICHLFIDGHFKTCHILRDPNILVGGFIAEINSACAIDIPWLSTDIAQTLLPDQSERNDHILQLIFFDSKYLAKEIHDSRKYFTYYRIFVFSSTEEMRINDHISIVQNVSSVFDSSTLVLHHTPRNDSIIVHWVSNYGENSNKNVKAKVVFVQNQNSTIKYEKLFDRTFGEFEEMWTIATRIAGREWNEIVNVHFVFKNSEIYNSNYFISNFNVKYTNMTCINYGKRAFPWRHKAFALETREYYQELSEDFQPINKELL